MEKNYVSGQMISISNPSDLVLNVDDFLRLSKKNPSPVESLQQKEEIIFAQLGERKKQEYPKLLMFELRLNEIANQINDKYQDGFYIEDERDIVQFPYNRTLRNKKQELNEPIVEKELSLTKITSIKIGKYNSLGANSISLIKYNPNLILLTEYESEIKTR